MDRRLEEFETDSTVDNTIDQMDPSDPEIHFRAQARGIDEMQVNFWRENLGPWLWDPGLTRTCARPLPPTLLVTSVLLSRPEAAVQLPRPAQLL